MKAKVWRGLAILILVVQANDSYAQIRAGKQDDCAPPNSSHFLSGKTEDSATGMAFSWSSVASETKQDGYSRWSIYNVVCNRGKNPLVVTWPKAKLQASAVSPLPPGGAISNGFTAGLTRPEPDADSPITYGLSPRHLTAQTYQHKQQPLRIGNLTSSLVGTLEVPGWTPAMTAKNIEMTFLSEPTANGYTFSYAAKSEAASAMSLGIISSQTSSLAEALKKAGVEFKIGKYSDFVKARSDQFDIFGNKDMIVVTTKANALRLDLPVQANEVEVAQVILIKDAQPIASGNVSLFHQ